MCWAAHAVCERECEVAARDVRLCVCLCVRARVCAHVCACVRACGATPLQRHVLMLHQLVRSLV